MFYIESIEIDNFRVIRNLELSFEDKRPVVLIGSNGSGKSSVLSAINIALAHFTARIRNPKSPGPIINALDVRDTAPFTNISIVIRTSFGAKDWTIVKYQKKQPRERESDYIMLRQTVEDFQRRLGSNQPSLPLVAYYPTNRAVLDIPLRVRGIHKFEPSDAYDSSFGGIGLNFRQFFEWFRQREDLENEQLRDNREYRDRDLDAVRQAIFAFDEHYSDLRVRRNPLRMTVAKHLNDSSIEIRIDQLSDGEKCALALIGDIARRLALANPTLEDPLQGEGIVLIDEIELHLHPNWQRRIIHMLVNNIFPNCQFIITTHSALVLSELKAANVFSLGLYDLDTGPVIRKLTRWYGRDSNRLLEDAMEDSDRPVDVKKQILDLFKLIDIGDVVHARELLDELSTRVGSDEPSFARANVLLRKMEIIGR